MVSGCAISIVFAAAVMISAARSDWICREISDIHWVLLAFVPAFVNIASGSVPFSLSVASMLIFTGFLTSRRIIVLACLLSGASVWLLSMVFWIPFQSAMQAYLSPVVILLIYGLYAIGFIRGGADAKCIMALSVGFPGYIGLPCDPMNIVFCPSVMTLFLACILTVVFGGLWVVAKGYGIGDFPNYRMSITEARSGFVWPLEDVVEGTVARVSAPDYDEIGEVYRRLESKGMKTVLVSPMFPFVVPMAAAFPLIIVFGPLM